MTDKQLLLPAILPDDATAAIIEEIRQEFAIKYKCRAALKPPVHITLVPPFVATSDELNAVESLMSASVLGSQPFNIQLSGYGAFTRNGVIFIDVVETSSLLELQGRVESSMCERLGQPIKQQQSYHPHITIGRKDIPRHLYPRAWQEYHQKAFECTFTCTHVSLLRHDGDSWRPHTEHRLN